MASFDIPDDFRAFMQQVIAYLDMPGADKLFDGRDPLGLYFGAESGEVFGSADGGASWTTVAEHLPPVVSVRVSS